MIALFSYFGFEAAGHMLWARAAAAALSFGFLVFALALLIGDEGSPGHGHVELTAQMGKAAVHAAAQAKVLSALPSGLLVHPGRHQAQKLNEIPLVEDNPEVAIATSIKSAIGDKSSEGANLTQAVPTDVDMETIRKIQDEVQAAADKEIDDALKDAQSAAESDYNKNRDQFMAKEATAEAAHDIYKDSAADIFPPEGSPGRPAGYARKSSAPTQAQRAARSQSVQKNGALLERQVKASQSTSSPSAQHKARAGPNAIPTTRDAVSRGALAQGVSAKGRKQELSDDDFEGFSQQDATEVQAELQRELGRLNNQQGKGEGPADREADDLYKQAISDLLKKITADISAAKGTSYAPPPVHGPRSHHTSHPLPHSLPLSNTVATSCGNMRGVQSDGVVQFKGIPYALPPMGERRWRPPLPANAAIDEVPMAGCWSGLKIADTFGAVCPQQQDAVLSTGEQQQEDCLFLNIYAPDIDSAEAAAGTQPLLPVIFFIHGGGNLAGAASRYDFSTVAKRGFVVVTANYRLGALGFLALEELSQESSKGVSGNYGLLDIALALKWVKTNIASFGGDSSRVTLLGHGAGGTNALALMVSPYGKDDGAPLFHHVLTLSAPPRVDVTLADGEKANRAFAVKAGCNQGGQEGLACLRKMSVDAVLGSSPLKEMPFWDPVEDARVNVADLPVQGYQQGALLLVDGHVIPQSTWKAFGDAALQAPVPLMMLYSSGDGDRSSVLSEANLVQAVTGRLQTFGNFWEAGRGDVDLAHEVIARYPVQSPGGAADMYARMVSDARLICPAKLVAGLAALGGDRPVFFGVDSMRLSNGVLLESLSSNGFTMSEGRGYTGADSSGALELLLYVRDESNFELEGSEAKNSLAITRLLDHFARTGTTEGGGQGTIQDVLSYGWKPVSDSPDFVVYDALGFPVHIDVAQINDGGEISMSYAYEKQQCDVWARDAIDRTYAASA